MLNVAMRKELLFASPCAAGAIPSEGRRLFQPHYISWSEQHKTEVNAPEFLRNFRQCESLQSVGWLHKGDVVGQIRFIQRVYGIAA